MDELRLPLHPPRSPVRPGFAIVGLILVAFSALILGAAAGAQIGPEHAWMVAGAAAGGSLAVLFALWARRRLRAPKEGPVLVLAADHLLLPISNGRRIDRVPLDEVVDVDVSRSRATISTAREVYAYAERSFVDPNGASLLAGALLQAIRAGSDGERRIEEMAHRRVLGRRAMAKRPLTTWTLTGILCAFYALEYKLGALGDSSDISNMAAMLRLGANSSVLVKEGEWFRLFTANFLHANLLHLYMNGTALLFLGAVLERLLGSSRLIAIYLLSALGGALGSVLFSRGLTSIGASTAIFGLLGAFGALQLRFGKELPSDFRRSKRWWLMIIGINGALPILVPIIDVAGHVGGALVGFIATYAIIAPIAKLDPGQAPGAGVRALAVVLSAAAVGAFAWCTSTPAAGDAALARIIAVGTDVDGFNALAWKTAIDRNASARDLALAAQFAERAVALSDEAVAAETIDTLATVHYRRGELDRAIELERRVVELKPDPVAHSQLARFLAARVAKEGAIGPPGVEVTRLQDELQISVPEELGTVEVFVLCGPPDQPSGLLRFTLEGERRFVLPRTAPPPFTLALVEPRSGPGSSESFTFTPRDPQVNAWP